MGDLATAQALGSNKEKTHYLSFNKYRRQTTRQIMDIPVPKPGVPVIDGVSKEQLE